MVVRATVVLVAVSWWVVQNATSRTTKAKRDPGASWICCVVCLEGGVAWRERWLECGSAAQLRSRLGSPAGPSRPNGLVLRVYRAGCGPVVSDPPTSHKQPSLSSDSECIISTSIFSDTTTHWALGRGERRVGPTLGSPRYPCGGSTSPLPLSRSHSSRVWPFLGAAPLRRAVVS